MKRPLAVIIVLAVLVGGVLYTRKVRNPEPETAPAPAAPSAATKPAPPPQADTIVGATLLEGLGNYHFEVTTSKPEAQRWFDQALMLTYGFNHDAAERSFLRATQIDPECAMCWWGASLVLGPHVNAAMDPANNDKAWNRLQKAVNLASKASPREQGYITALTSRYAAAPGEDRKPLDRAYASAMGKLSDQYPDDLDAAVMHAEAMMDLQPWDYYDSLLRPKGNTAEIVSTLESVMARNADHPGALHLYVHAVEASAKPERGVAAADRLRTLIPGSGHLVHMPAHIYSRVGRWHDAVLANQIAIQADDNYLAICRGNTQGVYPLGYVPHNHHFLWFAASMEGNSAIASSAAEQTSKRTDLPDLMRQPGFRRPAELLDDALVLPRALRKVGRNLGQAQSRARSSLRHRDLELRARHGGRQPRRSRRGRQEPGRAGENFRGSRAGNPDGLGPVPARAFGPDRDAQPAR
jgi:tetratricopeptide (TPR) repeat protein